MIQVEIYDICWKIIPYIYYSHTKEGTSRCTAIKRLKQFVGMPTGAWLQMLVMMSLYLLCNVMW